MLLNVPGLMDFRDEPIHEVRRLVEVWRNVIADVDRLFTKPTAKLRDVGYGRGIQRP